MSSALRCIAGGVAAGFAASGLKSRFCAKRRPCQLEAAVARMGHEVSKLQKRVSRQKTRLATLKDMKRKVKKLEKKLDRQKAAHKKMRIQRKLTTHASTSWERVARPTTAEANKADAAQHGSHSTGGEGAVGIHCAPFAGSSCAEAQVAGLACHPPEDRPNAHDIEKAKKLRAKHPGRIPVFCTPSAAFEASKSSPPLRLKFLVPEHMSWAELKGVLTQKLLRGRCSPFAAQSLTLVIGSSPLQADAPLSESFEASAGILHITYSVAG